MKIIISFILLFSTIQAQAQEPIIISTDRTNLLYSNLENDFNISRIPKNSHIEIEGCDARISKKSTGNYSIYPKSTGYVKVFLNSNQGKSLISTIKVVDIPNPEFCLVNGRKSGTINVNELINAFGIRGKVEDFEYEGIQPIVVSFNVLFDDGESFHNNGGTFNSIIKAKFKSIKSGTKIIFYNFHYKFSDGETKTYDSALSFTIE